MIFIDIDDTIAACHGPLLDLLTAGRDPGVFALDAYGATPEFFASPRGLAFFESLRPMPGAVEALNAISQHDTVWYVSARPEAARVVTARWLEKYAFPRGELILTRDKSRLASVYRPRLIVDDQPWNFGSGQRALVVFDQPWNRDWRGRRLFGWDLWARGVQDRGA